MQRITVVGSLNMDLVITTSRIPVIGETILGRDFMTVPGGKGANQAVAASRLGGSVSMVGCVGDDIFGRKLIKNLNENKVDVKNVKVMSGRSTGVAVIIVKEGDNCILVDPGANSAFTCQILAEAEELIKSSYIVMVQLEIPLEVAEYVIDMAARYGVKVLLNPAPARRLPDELLSKVDICTPNETECEILTGISIRTIEDAKKGVCFLKDKGIGNVVVTLGKNGVVYNNNNDILHKPVPDVQVIDTTAAGDCFSGALAVALSEGRSIDEAVDFGNKAGTLTVMKRGAQISLPYRKEIDIFHEICNV